MSLIKCPSCGAEIDNSVSVYCNICGKKISNNLKNGWVKMRKAFGITDLVIGIMFFTMIISSDGGIQNNSRMMGTSWFLICCGILQLIGYHRKGFTIASIVFYSLGIIFNFVCMFQYAAHFFIVVIMTVFITLTSVSLSDKTSFYK